jgi:outer membrane immunogenic protein
MGHFAKAFIGAAATILGVASAFAADLPRPAPIYKAAASVVAPAFSWTGFYVGANGGYGWKDPTVSYTPNDSNALASTCGGGSCVPSASFNVAGGIVGGQIGYNYQINSAWLVGVETDYDWARITGTGNSNFILGSVGPVTFVAKEKVESFGTLRARLGYIPVAPLLVYATGGLAYGEVRESADLAPGRRGRRQWKLGRRFLLSL